MKTKLSMLLENRRKQLNLKKKDVAEMMGVTRMYYARYENNNMLPSKHNLEFFSEFLEISQDELWQIVLEDRGGEK